MLLKNKKINIWLAVLTMSLVLSGCGAMGGNVKNQIQGKPDQTEVLALLETEPILNYEVPNVLPSILVNRIGYEAGADKIAIISGEKLPVQYHIVNSQTGDIVLSGNIIINEFNEKTKKYIAYADFSTLTEEGTYFLECDKIGRSYDFTIQEDTHEMLMTECINSLKDIRKNLSEENVIEICGSISILLQSYELYGSVYDRQTEDDHLPRLIEEVRASVQQLLEWQDKETGAMMNGETPLYEETAWLTAVLAKFSYTYQKFDSVYANACLQASDKAWKYLEKQDVEIESGLLFYGATELYRATGKYMYHASVKALGAGLSVNLVEEAQTFGTLTYASTKRKVDVNLCGSLLGVLLSRAEQIAEQAQKNSFGIGCSIQEESLEEILWDAMIISSMDYVITNNEYATIIQNYQNYIAGLNETAVNFIQFPNKIQFDIDEKEEMSNLIGLDYVNTASYIMILSEIMSHEQEE